MRRCLSVTAVGGAVALLLSGCGGSGSPTEKSTSSASSALSTATAPNPASSTSTTSAASVSTKAPSSELPTPKVTPPAHAAVDSYYADFNAGVAANRNPAHADLSWIAKYETGAVRKQTEQSYIYMKDHRLAWRGAAPNPTVKVASVLSPKAVLLTSCLLVDKSSPWVEYNIATGKTVPRGKRRNPPPPYLLRIFMRAGPASVWQITSVVQDTSKTCTG